ncbi:MAG: homoserine kinase [Methanomassiliicoccales archaeon]|jgi:homoserine kinase
MSEERVVVRAPSSLSNLGPGFDVFGLALKEPFDQIEMWKVSMPGVVIEAIEGLGAESIPTDFKRNSAGVSAARVLKLGKANFGVAIKIKKGVRPCSGIGSSGASAAGGAYAANLLLDKPVIMEQLVVCAANAEEMTSGSFHADNVGPALMGGFTMISSYDPFEILRVNPPRNLGIVVAMPDVMVTTKEARRILPRRIGLGQMVFEVSHASGLVLGMRNGDVRLVGRSMKDIVIEPARAHLVPHLEEAKALAIRLGATGAFLAGSGPCIAAVFNKHSADGKDIAESLRKLYEDNDIRCQSWVTAPGDGCRRIA